jgi:signal transduction histidine kinase
MGEQHALVAAHGGTLTVCEDAPAGERIFTLTFPVLQPKAAE